MTKSEVITLLKANKNERGIEHWKKLGSHTGGLKGLGIGLTQLRKIAKQIGRDHALAQKLWQTDIYDAKVVGLLIDDPKKLTRAQAEEQADAMQGGMLTHVFTACGATLAKAPFAFELARDWMESKDPVRRSCSYGLLYELSKSKKSQPMDDAFCLGCIAHIQRTIHEETDRVKDGMNAALMGIGKRNAKLNRAAIRAVKTIGPIEIDYGDNKCEPMDVIKHLTSDYIRQKLAT